MPTGQCWRGLYTNRLVEGRGGGGEGNPGSLSIFLHSETRILFLYRFKGSACYIPEGGYKMAA